MSRRFPRPLRAAAAGAFALAATAAGAAPPGPAAPARPGRDAGGAFVWESSAPVVGDPTGQTNTVNGNHLTRLPLVAWPARGGMPVAWILYHNSQGTDDGALGPKWSHTFDLWLAPDPATGDVVFHQGDGRTVTFLRNIDGSYGAPPGVRETLARDGDAWTLTTPARTVYRFSGGVSGRIPCRSLADRNGNAISLQIDASGRLVRVVDPSGRALVFSYASGRLVGATDPAGHVWNLSYDAAGDLVRVEKPLADGIRPTVAFAYNARHAIVRQTDEAGGVWLAGYDATDRLVSRTDPLGAVTRIAYGNATRTITDPLGATRVATYDARGRIVSETDPLGFVTTTAWDDENRPIAVTDPLGRTTRTDWDPRGNPLRRTLPDGRVVSVDWNAQDRPVALTLPSGRRWRYEHDPRGNVLRAIDPAGAARTVARDAWGQAVAHTSPLGATQQLQIDADGNPVRRTDPLGAVETASWDPIGLPLGVTDPLGRVVGIVYDGMGRVSALHEPGGRVWRVAYDPAGRRTGLTDPLGFTHRFAWNAAGRLVSETDPLGRVTRYAYDAAGRCVSLTDPRGKITRFSWNARGERTGIAYPDGTSESFSWNAVGQLSRRVDGRGVVATCSYDAADRLVGVSYSDGTPGVTLTWDPDDRQASVRDGSGTTSWTYDAVGRVTGQTSPRGTVASAWDADGNLISLGVTGVGTTRYVWDAAGRLARTILPDGREVAYTRDAVGDLVATRLPDGSTRTDTRDPGTGDLIRIWHQSASGATLARFDMAYDARGRRVRETLADGTATAWSYDAAGQLVEEIRTGALAHRTTYAWDAAGNRTERVRDGLREVSVYDDANRILSAGSRVYAHDAAGNVVRITDTATGALWNLSWDAENRLVGVSGAASAQYAHNGLGQRVGRTVGAASEGWIPLDDSIASPLLARGATGVVRDPQGPLAELNGGQTAWVRADALGSARWVGTSPRETDAFGAALAPGGGVDGFAAAWGYQGDPETGWMRLGHRMYDPVAGRFLSRDPILSGSNWYAYADNDPVNAVDPSGLETLFFLPSGPDIPTRGGGRTRGRLILRDDDGNILGQWPATSGGSRAPGSSVRPGQPTRLPKGRYDVRNPRRRKTPGMVRDDFGFSFDLEPRFPTRRSELRIHPDGGGEGTQGCVGILGDRRELEEFYRLIRDILQKEPLRLIAE